MPQKENSLVTAAELEALIQSWGEAPHLQVDKFFPIRFWYLGIFAVFSVITLLFGSTEIASRLSSDPEIAHRLSSFLYYRGWFALLLLVVGAYSYTRGWYTALVFSVILLTSAINFISDLFLVYPDRLANPTPSFTVFMLVRITVLWCMFMTIKNSSRMPDQSDRLKVLLPFSRNE